MNNTVLTGAAAQHMSAEDMGKARHYLAQSRDELLEAVSGLSEAQWRFKPTPNCWSIADNLEHLVIVSKMFERRMTHDFSQGAPPEGDLRSNDFVIVAKGHDRSRKFQTPPPGLPTGRASAEELVDAFRAACRQTASFLESTPDLRQHTMPHPAIGVLDGYQWLLIVISHWHRHRLQVLEVKAHPDFPLN